MARPHDPKAKIELLRAAEAVFVERGLDRAKVEEITSRAGRSKGSFYLHFASKEEAFRQIVETLVARLSSCVDDPPPVGAFDFEAMFAQQLEKSIEIFEFLWSNRALMRLLLSGGGSAAFGYLVEALGAQYQEVIARWLVWGLNQGFYRADLDVELTSQALAGAYDRVARNLVRQPRKPDLRAMVLELERFVARAVGTPPYIERLDRLVTNLKTKGTA